jgi:hypothetical protein
LTNQNKNTSDEFLVEKKSPLNLCPQVMENSCTIKSKIIQENQINNIESLITEKKSEKNR